MTTQLPGVLVAQAGVPGMGGAGWREGRWEGGRGRGAARSPSRPSRPVSSVGTGWRRLLPEAVAGTSGLRDLLAPGGAGREPGSGALLCAEAVLVLQGERAGTERQSVQGTRDHGRAAVLRALPKRPVGQRLGAQGW